MATYAIGDLQGCFDSFRRLLDEIGFSPGRDRLWLVGDLVNRGPKSLEILRYVRGLGVSATTVLGNHDLHLIMQAAGHGKAGQEDTLGAILTAPDRDELLDWLRHLPLFHVEGEWAMVHAGLLPAWDIRQAQALAAEVANALAAPDHDRFLAHMWGSEPDTWEDSLTGWDRLRVIVNAMTRMRYVTTTGRMELRAKGAKAAPGKGPVGCLPWFDAPGRKSLSHRIVCGHWSTLGFRMSNRLIALDSGCLWGGELTAVCLEDGRVHQTPCGRQVQPTGLE